MLKIVQVLNGNKSQTLHLGVTNREEVELHHTNLMGVVRALLHG